MHVRVVATDTLLTCADHNNCRCSDHCTSGPELTMASAGELAVTVDCNLFRGKTHVNPISRLLEPIANAIEHGRAERVDTVVERVDGKLTHGYGAAFCSTIMNAGQHYAEFTVTDESLISMVGVISNADFFLGRCV